MEKLKLVVGCVLLIFGSLWIIHDIRNYILHIDSAVEDDARISNDPPAWSLESPPSDGPRCNSTDDKFDGIDVRVYRPAAAAATGLSPAVVYFHGGGWEHGSIDGYDPITQRFCQLAGVVFISVGYRLTPMVTFPEPFIDCLKATKFLLSNAAQFGVESSRVAVTGDSAGANLAAAVALKLRDERFKPPLKMQLLFYPPLQGIDFRLPSMVTNKHSLTAEAMCRFTALYIEGSEQNTDVYCNNLHVPAAIRQKYIQVDRLPEKYLRDYVRQEPDKVDDELWNRLKDKLLDPYFSPLVADSLKDLPQTYMLTVDHDCLRDEGLLYVDRLRQDGVNVTHRRELTGPHSSIRKWLPATADYIKRHL